MENVSVPKNLWESLIARFSPAPEPPPAAPAPTEDFAARLAEKEAELERFRAEAAQRQAEGERAALIASLATELQDAERFGAMYVEVKGATEAAEVLAGMSDVQREWVMRNFSALAAQLKDSRLTAPVGQGGASDPDPVIAFETAIRLHMTATKGTYPDAAVAVAASQPELYAAYTAANRKEK